MKITNGGSAKNLKHVQGHRLGKRTIDFNTCFKIKTAFQLC